MSDLTVYAENLIAATARAFYDDDEVCLIDVLLRDKFLRDDDMAPRLNLPAKRLRAKLAFLESEHLVRCETVDDLAQGGSQATKFYYLDYCRAVHSIRLRIFLLRRKLEQAELRARSSSFYLCPGYKDRRCNGRYTEQEAQRVVDLSRGLFLCQECSTNYQNDPNAPAVDTYTLQLIDNATDLRLAMDNLRRVNVQFSAKFIGNQRLRVGLYDLLQKVRGTKGKSVTPITSNLPSENFSLGIGSTRLVGTGRTAGIKAKKMEQQGVAASTALAHKYLVGSGSTRGTDENLLFLKTALGSEVQFTVEKGGGTRARMLACRQMRRRKLLDAAASRLGAALPLHLQVQQRKLEIAAKEQKELDEAKNNKNNGSSKILMKAGSTFEFLKDNIGRSNLENVHKEKYTTIEEDEEDDPREGFGIDREVVLADDNMEMLQVPDDKRLISFQSQYQMEMDRQAELLHLNTQESMIGHPLRLLTDEEDIPWEDGDMQS